MIDHISILLVLRIFTGHNEVVAKVMFLLVSVILSTGGSASVQKYPPPPGKEAPPGRKHPPEGSTPRRKHPWEGSTPPPRRKHPLEGSTPRKEAPPPPGIRSMSGRYASYWNAFLFMIYANDLCLLLRVISTSMQRKFFSIGLVWPFQDV